MDLTETREDALTELINIGYGRAAGALSEMARNRVSLSAPTLLLRPADQLGPFLKGSLAGDVTAVDQVFFGPIAGNALLLLDAGAADKLTRLLDPQTSGEGHANIAEVLVETGNIILNACLGVFGNLLSVQLSTGVPQLVQVEAIETLLASLTTGWEPSSHALLVTTKFALAGTQISGILLIIFGVASLDRLIMRVDAWAATN